jgi:ribosomal protein S18 acetylase RimI-like enzyme
MQTTETIQVFTDKRLSRVDQIVDIHMQTFQGFLLTFLGKGFLRQLYSGFILHEQSNIIVAQKGDQILGFLAYSENMSGFYKWLIKKKLIRFAWYSLCASVRNPRYVVRLLRAFTKPSESKRQEQYIELASIGVRPECKNQKIGSRLIEELKKQFDKNQFAYITLETDAEGNDAVNRFYTKNGFWLKKRYITREGREMNEYRYC